MRTFKILGLLLTYPEGSLYSASDELIAHLQQEAILSNGWIKRVEQFLLRQKNKELINVQEDYVETFDRGRAHCLHLFEHIHGESRDRGQAMVDLSETYASKGQYINNNELPDYLPLFMEYLSRCSFQEASGLLGEAIDVIAMIGAKLKKRKSPYAVVFEAIELLSSVEANKMKIKEVLQAATKDPETFEELDEQWKEAEAFGGDPIKNVNIDCESCNAFPNTTKQLERMIGDTQ